MLFVAVVKRLLDLLVGVGAARNLCGNLLVRFVVKSKNAGKVARVTHVHCIGDGLDRWFRRVNTRLEVLIENVVFVVGCDETADRHSHPFAEESSRDISEVSGWNADDDIVFLPQLVELCYSIEVVECLREETSHVDGVGRCQFHVLVQVFVHKGGLDQSLAVVENTVDFQGCDVLSERRELTLLDRTYFTLRVEYEYADALHSQEAVRNGRACVSGSSYQYVHLFLFLLGNEVSE